MKIAFVIATLTGLLKFSKITSKFCFKFANLQVKYVTKLKKLQVNPCPSNRSQQAEIE